MTHKPTDLSEYSKGLATLLKVSRQLVSTLDLENILQAASDGVSNLMGLNTAAIYLVEHSYFRLWATTPPLPIDFPDTLRVFLRENHPHLNRSVSSGEPVVLEDALTAELTPEEQAAVTQRNLRTLLYLPLRTETEVLGALIVGSSNEPIELSDDRIRLSSTFANMAAMAVQNAQLYKEQQHYSRRLEQSMREQRLAEEERESLREELFHMQKMEAIGRLAGGVAHDFNNQLGGIMGFAELLHCELTDERQKKFASQIVSLAERSADLTSQLLTFARKGSERRTRVDLHSVIDEVVAILERTTHQQIAIQTTKHASISRTSGDPSQIQSALLNLAVNAKDAMPDGGTLAFQTRNIAIEGTSADPCMETPEPGDYLLVSVSDTGSGIEENLLTHIFEPFFTTKTKGRGTGMGLAAVYGTMKNHGGCVCVKSVPGQGSVFDLYFPVEENASSSSPSDAMPSAQPVLGKKILIVDDEASIVTTVSDHLSSVGHTVHSFTAPKTALAYFNAHHETVALVIVDMMMQEMDGPSLLRALKEANPSVRVLAISGFTPPEEIRRQPGNRTVAFLQKPFHRKDLLEAVGKLVG